MSTDYMNPIVKHKRRLEGGSERCDCQPKRVCSGLGSCNQVECDVIMDTWEMPQNSFQNGTSKHQPIVSMVLRAQGCPRCMAGEPGHINHIMQKY